MSGDLSRSTHAPGGGTPPAPAGRRPPAPDADAVPVVSAPSEVTPQSGQAPILRGEVLPPVPAGPYTPPQNGLDLVYRMWLSMTWSRTGQITMILLVAALLCAGLGLLAHPLGAATLWSAVAGLGLSGGAAACGRRYAAQRTRRNPSARKIRTPQRAAARPSRE